MTALALVPARSVLLVVDVQERLHQAATALRRGDVEPCRPCTGCAHYRPNADRGLGAEFGWCAKRATAADGTGRYAQIVRSYECRGLWYEEPRRAR